MERDLRVLVRLRRDTPLGASIADWLGKPKSANGLGFGSGPVSVVLAILIACAVAYLAVTRQDVQSAPTREVDPS